MIEEIDNRRKSPLHQRGCQAVELFKFSVVWVFNRRLNNLTVERAVTASKDRERGDRKALKREETPLESMPSNYPSN